MKTPRTETPEPEEPPVYLLMWFYGGGMMRHVTTRRTAEEWIRQHGEGEWSPKRKEREEEWSPEREMGPEFEAVHTIISNDDHQPIASFHRHLVIALCIEPIPELRPMMMPMSFEQMMEMLKGGK